MSPECLEKNCEKEMLNIQYLEPSLVFDFCFLETQG